MLLQALHAAGASRKTCENINWSVYRFILIYFFVNFFLRRCDYEPDF